MNTPIKGAPLSYQAIESLREDLRIHSQNDERELATIRQDVKSLLVDTSGQTEILEEIKRSQSRRAVTEDETVKYNRKKRLKILGAILVVSSAFLGALIHHFIGG